MPKPRPKAPNRPKRRQPMNPGPRQNRRRRHPPSSLMGSRVPWVRRVGKPATPPAGNGGAEVSDPRVTRAAELIRNIPDFPRPGIQFKDITPLLADSAAFDGVVAVLAEQAPEQVDVICGIESRGFLFGVPMALRLGVGFVPIRKPGKLPGTVLEETFDLEYGSSTLAIHADALVPGQRVLLVDDLLATGGTLLAAHRLVKRLAVQVCQVQVVIELTELAGRRKLTEAGMTDLRALLQVN